MKFIGYVYIDNSVESEVKKFNSIDEIVSFVNSYKEPVNVVVELNNVEIGAVFSIVGFNKTIVVDLCFDSILLKGE